MVLEMHKGLRYTGITPKISYGKLVEWLDRTFAAAAERCTGVRIAAGDVIPSMYAGEPFEKRWACPSPGNKQGRYGSGRSKMAGLVAANCFKRLVGECGKTSGTCTHKFNNAGEHSTDTLSGIEFDHGQSVKKGEKTANPCILFRMPLPPDGDIVKELGQCVAKCAGCHAGDESAARIAAPQPLSEAEKLQLLEKRRAAHSDWKRAWRAATKEAQNEAKPAGRESATGGARLITGHHKLVKIGDGKQQRECKVCRVWDGKRHDTTRMCNRCEAPLCKAHQCTDERFGAEGDPFWDHARCCPKAKPQSI